MGFSPTNDSFLICRNGIFYARGRIFSVLDDSFRISRDRIFSARGPYILRGETVYFQHLRTVYFSRPYILSRGPYIFSPRTVYFQPSGPYIFSLDRIFYGWPVLVRGTDARRNQCIVKNCAKCVQIINNPIGLMATVQICSQYLQHPCCKHALFCNRRLFWNKF